MAVELRRNDYSLSDEQGQLVDMLRSLFAQHAPIEAVRAAEPLGFDAALWDVVRGNGLLTIAIPEGVGGDGGGLVELALTGIEIGRSAAPVPLLDHVVALRTLAALVGDAQPIGPIDWEAALAGDTILSIAPISTWELGAELVPSGAVAGAVLALKDGDLVVLSRSDRAEQASNEGCAPVAWWSPTDAAVTVDVIASGERAAELWDRARREWRIATASSLVGILEASGEIARNYALERQAFGVTIAKFQSISHDLVNIHMDELTSRNMTLKAAWLTEFEPGFRPELAAMAMAQATRSALRSTSKAVHVHGGMGITLEADISLYYRKASAWSLVGGGVHRDLQEIGREIDRRAAALSAAAPATASTNR
ncbi:MAG: acyl-CoA dehydrogenase [Candidatus Nanopelagicales bacterium]|nr:acyl-CoA dehydrogenase [Candidatus Nanopelagicales bacterium]